MRLERTFDGQRMQCIVEHPSVLPHISLGDSHVDLVRHVENPDNVCLMNEFGGFLFVNLGDGEYEIHGQFLPAGRGVRVVNAMREALGFIFNRGHKVHAYVPDGNRGTDSLCRAFGFVHDGRHVLKTAEGNIVEIERRYLTRESFLCQVH
jgi:hypothetical protein